MASEHTNPDNSHSLLEEPATQATPARRASRTLGTAILSVGLALLAYGAAAFWIVPDLPPNGGDFGRLPSVYLMGAGILATLVGLITRELRLSTKARAAAQPRGKGIPTVWGLVVLVAILAAFFLVVSRL